MMLHKSLITKSVMAVAIVFMFTACSGGGAGTGSSKKYPTDGFFGEFPAIRMAYNDGLIAIDTEAKAKAKAEKAKTMDDYVGIEIEKRAAQKKLDEKIKKDTDAAVAKLRPLLEGKELPVEVEDGLGFTAKARIDKVTDDGGINFAAEITITDPAKIKFTNLYGGNVHVDFTYLIVNTDGQPTYKVDYYTVGNKIPVTQGAVIPLNYTALVPGGKIQLTFGKVVFCTKATYDATKTVR